jgi:beta-exotoxin I transport system ATP-binding protein
MSAIAIEQLTKFYGPHLGIKDVSLNVEEGEIFGFIGPNGAGKSTTIRTILGLLNPTSGTAKILGLDCFEHGAEVRLKIGYLPSEVNYYENMSSKELLRYHAGFYENVDLNDIERLAEMFELDLTKRFSDLSFGNKKKCGIIQCVLHKPEILILDEPTSGLDPLMQNRFFELLEEENKRGATIFFSSHILSEVQRMCERAAVIRNGEITAIEDIQELLKKQMKKCQVTFNNDFDTIKLPSGSQNEKWHKNKVSFEYVGGVSELVKWLSQHDIRDVVMEEPDLESIFMNYYER